MSRLDDMWRTLNERIDNLSTRVSTVESKETAATFDAVTAVTFADATALAPASYSLRFISDALREGGGTGTLAYFDVGSTTWRRVSDNAAVSV